MALGAYAKRGRGGKQGVTVGVRGVDAGAVNRTRLLRAGWSAMLVLYLLLWAVYWVLAAAVPLMAAVLSIPLYAATWLYVGAERRRAMWRLTTGYVAFLAAAALQLVLAASGTTSLAVFAALLPTPRHFRFTSRCAHAGT